MTKVKYFILLFILTLILIIPNVSNAATEYTYSDTKQGIEWSYELDNSGNVVNLKCKTTSIIGAVTIPSTIDGKTVISLKGDYDKGAFQNCAGLTGITIPNTIQTIGDYAFANCTGLKTVTIPNSVTKIGARAFSGCTGLKTITLSNKLTSINMYAFSNCSGLTSLTIPDSVTAIGNNAFEKCSGLTQLTLSKNLSKIPAATFKNCNNLTSVVLPNSVTTISASDGFSFDGAFDNCTNLTKILIPNSVATIDKYSFNNCKKLTIYGNDGMKSKEYAEENSIPFDYIANWNKQSSSTDITPPTVKSIYVPSTSVTSYYNSSSKMYEVPTGTKLLVTVEFSETIKGTTMPTLTIKFGDGQNIKLTDGRITGSTITYTYTIKNTDKGIMATVDFSGGNITDSTGNTAKLTCPALSKAITSAVIYANGTTPVNNGGSSNSGTNVGSQNGTNSGTSTNSTTGTSSNNNKTKNNNDTTIAKKLPQTGVGVGLSASILVSMIVAIALYKKYGNYKDIK